MKEKLDLIQIQLEKLFDKVTIEYDSSPDIRFFFEQNGHRILKTFPRNIYEPSILGNGLNQFVSGLSINVMHDLLGKE